VDPVPDPLLLRQSGSDLSRSHVMGSNDAILCEAGRTTAVSLVGTHRGPGDVLGHSFGTPPRGPAGQRQSRRLDQYDYRGWQLSSHKRQWRSLRPEPPT
jgi:hypothetical protein